MNWDDYHLTDVKGTSLSTHLIHRVQRARRVANDADGSPHSLRIDDGDEFKPYIVLIPIMRTGHTEWGNSLIEYLDSHSRNDCVYEIKITAIPKYTP